MPTAIQIQHTGGPDVLEVSDVPAQQPGPGELLVEVAAAGVNFIDTYQRSGLYPVDVPFVLGQEGAGSVLATGDDVTEFTADDRVAWQGVLGSYAQRAIVPAAAAVRVPDGVDSDVAAATMLQGMTAHYLVASTYPVSAGETVLVHAAAGGVGLLLIQLAKARGARVFGTVSTAEKARLARAAGADEVIDYTTDDFATAVRELTGGAGVHVVYDGVGQSTFEGSMASLRRRGMLALFGGSSGPVPPLDPQRLNTAGSLFLTRPKLADYTAERTELDWRAQEFFDAIAAGKLNVRVGERYTLSDARRAHEDLEARRTTGKLLLLP